MLVAEFGDTFGAHGAAGLVCTQQEQGRTGAVSSSEHSTSSTLKNPPAAPWQSHQESIALAKQCLLLPRAFRIVLQSQK